MCVNCPSGEKGCTLSKIEYLKGMVGSPHRREFCKSSSKWSMLTWSYKLLAARCKRTASCYADFTVTWHDRDAAATAEKSLPSESLRDDIASVDKQCPLEHPVVEGEVHVSQLSRWTAGSQIVNESMLCFPNGWISEPFYGRPEHFSGRSEPVDYPAFGLNVWESHLVDKHPWISPPKMIIYFVYWKNN